MDSITLAERRKDAEDIENLKSKQVKPKRKHIKQARAFHNVLCKKGFDALDKACTIQALMDMARGKR
ncbi:MAG: hypothetical protein V3T82_08095 [Nitrospinaceae bacterium]